MAYICSIGTSIPKFNMNQAEIKAFVPQLFGYTNREVKRLLPVFDHAQIDNRQFVVDETWFEADHTFAEKNQVYHENAISHSLDAIDDCLQNTDFLKESIPYDAVDLIIYVSSSGIAAPSIDAYLLNERSFRQDVERMPLWGLGCAGGAIGLSRAFDFVKAHPEKTVLVICCELCSITFQKQDDRKSNIVGTALFGDGISSAFVVGEDSPYLNNKKKTVPRIMTTSSRLKKMSTSIMGWDVTDNGLQVVFSKSIPALVGTFWQEHLTIFLEQTGLTKEEMTTYITHPGGSKVLQAMKDVLQVDDYKFQHAYHVLKNHGNMSSATVFYVLKEAMKAGMNAGDKSLLSALGPGFYSELLLLEGSS